MLAKIDSNSDSFSLWGLKMSVKMTQNTSVSKCTSVFLFAQFISNLHIFKHIFAKNMLAHNPPSACL